MEGKVIDIKKMEEGGTYAIDWDKIKDFEELKLVMKHVGIAIPLTTESFQKYHRIHHLLIKLG